MMLEADQLDTRANRWDSALAPIMFEVWTPNATRTSDVWPPRFVFTSLAGQPSVYLDQTQAFDATNCVEPVDEETIQNALASLNQLFACQPDQVIKAFANYLSLVERYVDGPWNGQREEALVSGAVSLVPPDRQVRIETAARDHVIHLETMILAKEQEAPNASSTGQILTSGGNYGRNGKGSYSIRSQSARETALRLVFKSP